MMQKKVTKLWLGKFVSVRDYEVSNAIKKGGLVIKHNNEQMILKPNELSSLKPNPKPIQSKFKGTYKLVDITFKPMTDDPRQASFIWSTLSVNAVEQHIIWNNSGIVLSALFVKPSSTIQQNWNDNSRRTGNVRPEVRGFNG